MAEQDRSRKASTGPNARPKDETIAQTGPGFPNDTGGASELPQEEAKAEQLSKRFFKRQGKDRPEEQRKVEGRSNNQRKR